MSIWSPSRSLNFDALGRINSKFLLSGAIPQCHSCYSPVKQLGLPISALRFMSHHDSRIFNYELPRAERSLSRGRGLTMSTRANCIAMCMRKAGRGIGQNQLFGIGFIRSVNDGSDGVPLVLMSPFNHHFSATSSQQQSSRLNTHCIRQDGQLRT